MMAMWGLLEIAASADKTSMMMIRPPRGWGMTPATAATKVATTGNGLALAMLQAKPVDALFFRGHAIVIKVGSEKLSSEPQGFYYSRKFVYYYE